jgi:hypothetical protein
LDDNRTGSGPVPESERFGQRVLVPMLMS